MSVRPPNSSGPGLVNTPSPKTAAPAPAPAKNTVVEKPASKLPDQLHSSFEREGQINRDFNKSYNYERPMNSPKLPTTGFGGALAGLLGKLPAVGKSGQFEAGVSAYKNQGSFGQPGGNVSGNYSVSALEASVRGSGSVSFANGAANAHGELHAQATLVDASANIKAKLGPLNAEGEAHAYAGAKANLQGDVTIDPVNGKYGVSVGGDAFLGARAGVSGTANLGDYAGVHGSAEAWAGIGAKFNASASLENGRFKARFEIGAALGLGFKLGFGVDINFKKIADGIKNIVKKPVEFAKNIAKKAGDFFKGAGEKVKAAGTKVLEGIKDVGNGIKEGVSKAANKVKNFFKSLF